MHNVTYSDDDGDALVDDTQRLPRHGVRHKLQLKEGHVVDAREQVDEGQAGHQVVGACPQGRELGNAEDGQQVPRDGQHSLRDAHYIVDHREGRVNPPARRTGRQGHITGHVPSRDVCCYI